MQIIDANVAADSELCNSLNLPVSAMSDNWDVFSLQNDDASPTLGNFGAFRDYLSAALKKQGSSSGDKRSIQAAMSPSAAGQPKKAARISTSPGMLYEDRKNVGSITAHINSNLADHQATSQPAKPPAINAGFKTNVSKRYRYMFTTQPERAKALDTVLTSLQEQMQKEYGIKECHPTACPSSEDITVVGRVCNEAHEGRMNKVRIGGAAAVPLSVLLFHGAAFLATTTTTTIEKPTFAAPKTTRTRASQTSVLLEGSRGESGGHRVALSLEALNEYSLFPGQIVGVEGCNPTGRKVVAKKLCEGCPKPMATSKPGDLLRFHYDNQSGVPLSVFAAAGPFTTTTNLEFEPLADFLAIIARLKPDVVILMGPFVDIKHPLFRDGVVQMDLDDGTKASLTFEGLFSEKLARMLEDTFLDNPDLPTQFILVPSLDDAFHENVFPQPPFSDRCSPTDKKDSIMNIPGGEGIVNGSLGLQFVEEAGRSSNLKNTKRVHCVSNPATFAINEVVFGVTSVDPIWSLNIQECGMKVDRIPRLASHLIKQQVRVGACARLPRIYLIS